MPKRVQISINIEDCVSQNRRVVWSPAACDSLGVYMRRITYDSATVNISVFIEQRNISFQHDISLTTMRLGVLSWEQLKNRETHDRIVSFDQLREIADLFVMFIAWTSQKASKVHKLVSKLAIVLICNIQSPHEDNRPVPPVKCTKSAHRGTATNTRDSCRSDIGRCLHLGDTFAYCRAHSNLFLTLHVIHKLKTLICVRATSLSRSPWPSSCGELRNVSHKRLPYHSVPYGFVCNILIGKMLMTKVSVTKEVSCIILCKNLCSSVPCLFFIKTRFD